MSLGLIILITLLGIIFLALTYLLFVPITLRIDILIDKKVSAISEINVFPFKYKFIRKKKAEELFAEPESEKVEKAEKKEKKAKKGLSLSALNRSDIVIIFELVTEALKYLGRLVKAPHYFLRAEIAGGAAEPDLTGEIYGAYEAIRFILPQSVTFSYRPDFLADKFNGKVEIGLMVRIIKLLKETLVFIFRLPIIKLIKLYRKLKRGGKDGK